MFKKGLSAIVATLLIMVLTIAGVVVLWAAIKPGIEKGTEEIGTSQECMSIDLKIDKAVYDNGTLTVTVNRARGNGNLTGITFLIDGKKAEEADVIGDIPEELETSEYEISVEDKPDKVEIAGIVGDNKPCSTASKVEGDKIKESEEGDEATA